MRGDDALVGAKDAGRDEQRRGKWRFSEFARLDNLTNRNYVGSVIVNKTNFRYFEPAPRRSKSIGVQASVTF